MYVVWEPEQQEEGNPQEDLLEDGATLNLIKKVILWLERNRKISQEFKFTAM